MSGHFNPRSPHGERRSSVMASYSDLSFQSTLPARGATRSGCWISRAKEPFQSTLPARGATHYKRTNGEGRCNFNPRSPHGERPMTRSPGISLESISIHAPRTGSDRSGCWISRAKEPFQSTLPARGATQVTCRTKTCGTDFNPRSPHGERRAANLVKDCRTLFQSTLPARGATTLGVLCPPS